MYCRVCGAQIADNSKFCSECGANQIEDTVTASQVQTHKPIPGIDVPPVIEEVPRLSKAERQALRKKRAENTKKLLEQDKDKKEKQDKLIKDNKTYYPLLALIFSFASVALMLIPLAVEIKMSWWYNLIIFLVAFYGTYYARRARDINKDLYNEHRIKIHPGWVRVSFIMACISMGVALIKFFSVVF